MRISTKLVSSDRLQYVQLSLQFTTTALDREVLSIRLTDPADPLFLYCSNIDQNDFLSLKRHQDIKVDFRSFPLEVQHLVQLCVAEADAPMPRYVCELRCADDHGGAAAVHLIETNTFKNLNHLTLSVVPGDDGAIKAYLADCLKQLQAENSHLSSNCEDMAATIDSLRESLAVSEETRVRAEDEHARALHDATQRLQREKEEAVASTRQQLERARRETETSLTQEHERRVHASRQDAERLQARVEELTRSNEEMVKLRYSLEARVNELEVQLSRCQEQLDERTQRAEQHRARADDLAANKRAVEEELTRAHARIDELRQQCDAHTRAAADTEQTVADLQAQLEDKSKELEDTKEHADTLTRTLQSCHAEIHRGNAIITQYQKDLADATSGLDARDRVTVEQERRVKELEAETKRLQEDVAGLQREYEAAMQRNKEQTAELHALTGTVDTQQQELKAKERMIAWLSKRQQELEEKEREVALNSVAAKKRVPLGGIDVNGAFVFQAPGAKRQQFADKPADPAAAKSRAPAQFRPTNRQKQQQQQQQRGVPQPHPMPTKPTTDYSLLLSAP
ncbi:hypothetical protein PTSG_08016 [Salpingoeca rosetta]|uniref:Spindle assembly abnormal protein 6 N-terminal domain-containing protein n=1 Tax=Salpingoeca rosetta (strain ATCC 50818 / BSB-021) TaxID=946362 RepID=F2UHR7_SALR5|nr:uncharacterized protein PTSG_08016 [Salpingoeca rosetta]EGD76666.1 hypothetical protein PTSG_08016 [Salpingoeca rosetta]|eukprot:XP_004991038.1 hypothetical protein PTSG_08016 [Salpingoeca rosetta]